MWTLLKKRSINSYWSVRDYPTALDWKLICLRIAKFSTLLFAFLVGWKARELDQYQNTYEWHRVHIIEKVGDYDYTVALDGQPEVAFVKFCHDFRPDFDPGMELVYLKFEDRGSCKSIADKDLGFQVVRDANHKAVLTKFYGAKE